MAEMIIRREGEADARISGEVLAEVSFTPGERPAGDQWDALTLLRQPDGAWIIAVERKDAKLGEVGQVHYVRRPQLLEGGTVYGLHGEAKDAEEADAIMVRVAMKSLGWSWLAKKLAAHMKWDVVANLP